MPKREIWSYSKLSAYEQCQYQYYLKYIESRGGVDNFYSTFGSLIHKLLEQILKKEIAYEEAVDYYIENFGTETIDDAPKEIIEKSFEQGLLYLADVSFDWLYDEFDIIGVEQMLNFQVDKYTFVGIIDLLLKNKESGEYAIIDHKSSRYPFGKTGKPLKALESQAEHFENQLYLYAEAVKQKYGKYPVQLTWNYFKAGKWYSIPFNEAGVAKAQDWALGIISQIKKDNDFDYKEDFFYCNSLCEFRDTCEYKLMKDEDEDDGSSSRSLDI